MDALNHSLYFGIIIGILITYFIINLNHPNSTTIYKVIQTLSRGAARWSTAAKQDQNSMIAVLHANYGAAYLWALNDVATSNQITQVTGIPYQQFRDEIVHIQDQATMKMAGLCPQYAPKPSILTKLGGEGYKK